MAELSIAVFGGSFNPPTNAHMAIIRHLLSELKLDKVLLVPCGKRDDKPHLADENARVRMLGLACREALQTEPAILTQGNEAGIFNRSDKLLIDDFELRGSAQMIPTAFLLQQYQNRFPGCQIYFVMGSDLLHSIDQWELFDAYLRFQNFIVYQRTDEKTANHNLLENAMFVSNIAMKDVSSTHIRKVLARHFDAKSGTFFGLDKLEQDLNPYLCKELLGFIIQEGLYVK